jgi:hypothetical protein
MYPQFDAKLGLVVFFERIMLSVEELKKLLQSFQTLWMSEAKKRRDEIRSGEVKPISGEEVLVEVRRLLDK